jgi:hypothetical protein
MELIYTIKEQNIKLTKQKKDKLNLWGSKRLPKQARELFIVHIML